MLRLTIIKLTNLYPQNNKKKTAILNSTAIEYHIKVCITSYNGKTYNFVEFE